MMNQTKAPAFTLIEMLISITVFTIFIGTAMGTYNAFNRTQQEAADVRELVQETERIFEQLTESIQENRIDYDRYLREVPTVLGPIQSSNLYLVTPDAREHIVYKWDPSEKKMSLQHFDSFGLSLPGYTEALDLHTEQFDIDSIQYFITPTADPYDNPGEDDLAYQPIVQVKLKVSRPGRVRDVISMDLQTSITSRFYSQL